MRGREKQGLELHALWSLQGPRSLLWVSTDTAEPYLCFCSSRKADIHYDSDYLDINLKL